MITSDTNFRGNFDSIEAVWEAIPYGGVEGDYLNIQGVKYRWNKYLAMWENAEVVTETPARETVTFDEDVNMQNNLTVAGVLRAKKFVVDDLPTGIEEVEITESAVSGGNNVITFTYTNGETQTFNVKNGEAGKTMGAFGYASSTASQSTWDTAKNYLVPTATEGEFDVYTYEDGAWYQVDTFQVDIAGSADAVVYDDTTTQLSADNVQEAIEALNNKTYPIDDELDETSTLPVQNKVVTEAINDISDNVFTFTTEDIPLTIISGKYYTYNEGIQILDNANFSCASPVDISKYIKVSLNFYVAPNIESGTYFTDENGEMVGVKMTNTTGTYKDFDVPEGAKWLYLTTRTKSQAAYGAKGIIRTAIKDDVADIEEKIVIPKELSITSYPERRYVIAISTGKWTALYQTDKKHILVPVGDFVKFRITGGGDNYSIYSFLKSNAAAVASGTPDYATGYTGVKLISKGVTKDVDIPEDALYLYLSLRSIDNNGSAHYEPQALYGLNDIDDVVVDNRSRIEALEEEQVTLPYEYFGSKINFNKKFHYNITSWMSMSVAHQSGASFGNYYFMLTNLMANVYVYNLASKTRIFTWTNLETLSGIHHCNQCDFSTLYYDANDPFPILYVSVKEQTSGQYNGRCSIEAYRIIATMQDDEYTSFDFVKVQTIYLPSPTTNNGMNDAGVAIDGDRKRMVIYSKNLINGLYLSVKISELNIPALYSGGAIIDIVDLTDNNFIVRYDINVTGMALQGAVIHNCKLFIGKGYANVSHIELIAVDLIEQSLIAEINLLADGFTAEPEGAFIYNDELYISTNNNAIFKVEFE